MEFIRRPLLATWILVALAASAFGGEFSDPSGFSFTYPSGWVVVNCAAMNDARQALPNELRDWVTKNKVDFSQVAVVVLRDGAGDFLENLNVVVNDKQQIAATKSTVERMTNELAQQYQQVGIKITDLKVGIEKAVDRDVIVADYRTQMPNTAIPMRQKQVLIPGGGKTYTITFTAKLDTYERYRPALDKMLASFKAPEPTAFVLNQTLTYALVGGVVGGLIGALGWLAKKFSRKSDAG
jgi:hypothetical protein